MLFLIRHKRNAFTLIELLVVIGIISVLMAISLLIGSRVVSGGKARVTTDTIRVLDSAMSDYVNRVGRIPDSTVRIKTNANASSTVNLFPVFDAFDTNMEVQINTVGLFIEQGQGTSGIATTIATLNPKFVRSFDPDGPGGPQPELTTVFDGWDRPIRYVHPTFDGRWIQGTRGVGTPGNPVDLADAAASPIKNQNLWVDLAIRMVRRNFLTDDDRENWTGPGEPIGDSDGGICPSPRPYFYSPGEDGDPSAIDDNVYTTKPRVPKE
jgi:prepilin-type N-terminal cleavage/methylation domain-containing protein